MVSASRDVLMSGKDNYPQVFVGRFYYKVGSLELSYVKLFFLEQVICGSFFESSSLV